MNVTVKDCHYPWRWMMVTSDGVVKPCCFAPGTLGNLHESTADEIWNNEITIELRRFIKADKIHPVCTNAPCKYVQNMIDNTQEKEPGFNSQSEFDEAYYLEDNTDVAQAVQQGIVESGWHHYLAQGKAEGRQAKIIIIKLR